MRARARYCEARDIGESTLILLLLMLLLLFGIGGGRFGLTASQRSRLYGISQRLSAFTLRDSHSTCAH